MTALILSLDNARKEHPFGRALRMGYGRIVARALANEVQAAIARGESRAHAIARVIKPKSSPVFDAPKVAS